MGGLRSFLLTIYSTIVNISHARHIKFYDLKFSAFCLRRTEQLLIAVENSAWQIRYTVPGYSKQGSQKSDM